MQMVRRSELHTTDNGCTATLPRRFTPVPADEQERINRRFEKRRHGERFHREFWLARMHFVMSEMGFVAPFVPSREDITFSPAQGAFSLPTPHGVERMPYSALGIEYTGDGLDDAIATAFVALRFAHVGDQPNCFRISEALCCRLMNTQLRGVLASDVRLPFSAFLLELPPGAFWLSHPETGLHEVRVMQVVECFDTAGRSLLIGVQCEPNEKSAHSETTHLCFKCDLARDDEDIESQNADRVARFERLVRGHGRIGQKPTSAVEVRNALVQLVVSVCLYLGSSRADVRHAHAEEIARLRAGKKLKHLRKTTRERVERLERDRTFVVGSDVRIDPAIREQVFSGAVGHSLAYRTIVRGHWKRQPHGEGRALRKMIWIQPYVKGGEGLPERVIGHEYRVA